VAEVTAVDGRISVRAGPPGDLGWEGPATSVATVLRPVQEAIARFATTLTIDRLVTNRRYRVKKALGGLSPGDVVTFAGFDDIDNHYGEYVFVKANGERVAIGGDYSRPETSALGPAYVYLDEA
jgi:hypothetical protein